MQQQIQGSSNPFRAKNVSFDCIIDKSGVSLVEEKIDYHFQVEGFICYHNLNVEYQHTGNEEDEVFFKFCLTLEACLNSLSVKRGDKTIVCEIKETEEAKKQYEEAIKEGKAAALGELKDGRGYLRVSIGNLSVQEKFSIQFSYIQTLNQQSNYLQMIFPFKKTNVLILQGEIKAQGFQNEISETKIVGINKVVNKFEKISSSHFRIKQEFENINSEIDFPYLNVIFTKQSMSLLSAFQNDSEISPYCCLVSSPPPQIDSFAKFKFPIDNKEPVPSEFIIVVDRSGSMSGLKMDLANQSVIIFLKSLPQGSIYNVISFGTSFEFLHEESLQLNDENLQLSISQIEKFTANFGGTTISMALEHLFSEVQDEYGLRRKIFLITDGQFEDAKKAEDKIQKNKEKCDLNILGIGNDCDKKCLERLSHITGGIASIVYEAKKITPSVIDLLKNSFKKQRKVNLSLQISSPECVNFIVPNPQLISYINPQEHIRFFIFLNRKLEDIKDLKISLNSSQGSNNQAKLTSSWNISIDDAISQESAPLHKLGLYALIKQAILSKKRKTARLLDDLSCALENAPNNCQELLKNEAIRHQILCEFTSFVGVIDKPTIHNTTLPDELNCVFSKGSASQVFYSKKRMMIKCSAQKKEKSSGCCDGGFSSGERDSNSRKGTIRLNDISYGQSSAQDQQGEKDILHQKILIAQKVNGSWKEDGILLSLFGLDSQKFASSNPIESNVGERDEIWFSQFIIEWLQQSCKHKLDIHQYILLKGIGFIDRSSKKYSISDNKATIRDILSKINKELK